jgi:hypothetical protein
MESLNVDRTHEHQLYAQLDPATTNTYTYKFDSCCTKPMQHTVS